jgi:hypothetical protein
MRILRGGKSYLETQTHLSDCLSKGIGPTTDYLCKLKYGETYVTGSHKQIKDVQAHIRQGRRMSMELFQHSLE